MKLIKRINKLKNTAISGVILVSLILLPVPLSAENISIGVVSVSKIMKQAPQAEHSSIKLNAKFMRVKEKLAEQLAEIKKFEMTKETNALSAEEKKLRERSIRKRKREHSRAVDDFREELRFARDLALDKIQNEVYQAIHVVRAELDIDIIVQDYVSANPRIDITDQVLIYLKEKMKQKQINRNSTPIEQNDDDAFIPQ
jgi:outer membrane protein